MGSGEIHPTLALEYEQINENIRFLADVRFKLLALVPTLGGVAAFILARRVGLQSGDVNISSRLELITVVVFGLLGFLATLGITLYDQRNSELYNALIHRAKHLEKQFGVPSAPGGIRRLADGGRLPEGGQYTERPLKNRRLIFKAGHDLSLAVIYGPLLGAWLFPIFYAVARFGDLSHEYAFTASVLLAGIGAASFIKRLNTLDTNDSKLYNDAAEKDEVNEDDSANRERTMNAEKTVPESFKAYEDGKHRRYQLLFTVNGGAFAVAKLFVGKDALYVLGSLSLRQLAIGMFLFTVVMSTDIFLFGEKMRKTYLPDAFAWQGKLVLILIGTIICVGWGLVAQ